MVSLFKGSWSLEKGDLHFDSKIYFNIFVWRLIISYMYLAGERETLYFCFFFSRFRLYYNNVIANNLHLLGSRKQSRQTGGGERQLCFRDPVITGNGRQLVSRDRKRR